MSKIMKKNNARVEERDFRDSIEFWRYKDEVLGDILEAQNYFMEVILAIEEVPSLRIFEHSLVSGYDELIKAIYDLCSPK
ncbi:hypothetical protein GCM10008910_29670 [Faecalicatena orotica]|uniref:Uncharacterized protein n=1 Tax=Faecalicatena orotica TaxID=1544 RepID=A0A2Y9BF93_9FIRM|nr:hypothetical protein [Faecalicatena orotica]PWJ29078.1 hypothetical protein A8806_107227 [Faecalicatena orotica]SSA56248.1 hypothetical protein SAMN05216536_107227 [Faecalicatena orotica]